MRRSAQRLAVILATGYVLFFYSERLFWSFPRPGDGLGDLGLTWLVYSALAWGFLLLVREYRIAAFVPLFLGGAIYGWLTEGVVVDTLYGGSGNPFPVSISFTALAWHALITVGVGWYAQARVLLTGRWERVAGMAGLVGLGWGLWAGWWPAELGRSGTSIAAFAAHAAVTSALLIVAWAVLGVAQPAWFRPVRYEAPVYFGLAALAFLGLRVPATPNSLWILPPLVLSCGYGLRCFRARERRPDVLEQVLGGFRPRLCLALLVMPLTAVAVYAPVAIGGWVLPTNWILYLITMPLGFILLILSLWRAHGPWPYLSRSAGLWSAADKPPKPGGAEGATGGGAQEVGLRTDAPEPGANK